MRRAVVCAVIGVLHAARAATDEPETHLFRDPTFEQLADATVTSITRAPLPQFTAPAAAYVLTAQDVRATGARNVPDALRFAPGVQVAQFDAHTWAISARGFNRLFAEKLLVLIDGRPVYTPLWSGVYWEDHGWLDPDLDSIEVIRGPGGSTWGANAVNGVINILSKPARDTQGLALEVGGGDEERAFGSVRYGDALGDNASYRVYADYQEHDDSALANGADAGDAWNMARGGVRYERTDGDAHLMVKGEGHSGEFDEATLVAAPRAPFVERPPSGSNSGGYLQTTWSRALPGDSELHVGAWWEHTERRLAPSNEENDTLNLDLGYRTVAGAHTLFAQLGYRRVDHDTAASFVFSLSPRRRILEVWSVALQDEIALAPDLTLTAGVRGEHHDFTGWEWQPDVRLSWRPDERQTLWASIGRAVRTPSLFDRSGRFVVGVAPAGASGRGSPPTIQQLVENPQIESEELTAWEVGWRRRWAEQATVSVSAFYNDYDDLITFATQPLDTTTRAPEFWRIPVQPVNAGSGRAYGSELSALWQPTPQWRLDLELSWLALRVQPRGDRLADQLSGSSPRWQASLRSSHPLGNDWRLGAALRYVDELESLGVDSFVGADLRLARRIGAELELAIVGRNLWSNRHAEFRSQTFPVATYVERSAFVTLCWRL